MAKRFKYIRPRNMTITTHTGSRIDQEARCAHGQGAVFISLFGNRPAQHSPEQRIDTLVPRCVLAELFASVQAQIAHEEGDEALAEFLAEVAGHKAPFTAELEDMRESKRDCCEAGFTTNGREHTCGRNEAQQ